MNRRNLAILAGFIVASPIRLFAQEIAAPVAVGDRVRLLLPHPAPKRFGVFPPERWLVGELLALTADTLTVRPHPVLSPIAVPRTAVSRLDVSRGAPSRWRSAAVGVVEGAVFGLLWGNTLYNMGLRGRRFEPGARARLSGAVFGAVTGVTFGAVFPRERWRRIPLER